MKKSGQTARLAELKRDGNIIQHQKSKEQDKPKKKNGKSYSVQMKELLKESLRKNDKVK